MVLAGAGAAALKMSTDGTLTVGAATGAALLAATGWAGAAAGLAAAASRSGSNGKSVASRIKFYP